MTPAMACKRLGKDFYDSPCRDMARKLLGKLLCCASPNGVMKGRIVETEMYPGMSDPASHSYEGKKTSRNSSMFKEPGTAYVYSIYGMYYCFNISSQEIGGCVLIRALEPVEGIDIMMSNRNLVKKGKRKTDLKETELCSGPSKLCQALKVAKDGFNGMDMADPESSLWLEAEGDEDLTEEDIFVSTRIGIDSRGQKVASLPYRFYVKNNPHVSQLDPKDKAERKEKKLKIGE